MRLTVRIGDADQDNFNELQRAYNACVAVDTVKQVGIAPLQGLLGQLTELLTVDDSAFGNGVPIQAQDSKSISEAILFLEKLSISSFFSLYVGADDKNPV